MVKILKLISGDILIGTVEEDGDRTLVVRNPGTIAMTQQGVGLGPFIPFLKSEVIEIKKDHILCQGELETEVLNAYNSQFGSGIVVPDAGSTLKISDFES